MAVAVKNLKPASNEIVLDRLRKYASTDYQRRIPEATKAGIQATLRALQENRPLNNEFIDALVNRIGLVVARNNSWSNPLAEFKRGMLEYGDTIEEINVGLIKSKGYDSDRDSLEKDLFGTERPEVQSSFHKINRQDKYKVTVNPAMLQRAFLQDNGLTNFTSKLMEAPTISDNWDEFLVTCSLFSQYESNGGFFKVQVPNVLSDDSTAEDAKAALRKLRAMADNLTFISTKYNASNMPVAANRDELLIFVTPEFAAAIDVEALSAAFNLSNAQMHGRIIPIPAEQFGIDGVQAIMTTSDFFVIADSLFETASLYNPDSLQNNYWLHHHQVISASRFVPAIMFTTKPGDDVPEISNDVLSVSGVTATDRDGNTVTEVERGELYQFTADVLTELEDGSNEGVRWDVDGAKSVQTFIRQTGVLHVSGNEGATELTVTATSVYLDDDNLMQDGESASATVTVTGPSTSVWPVEDSITGITVDGVAVEPAFTMENTDYTVNIEGGTATEDDVVVSGPDSGDVIVTANDDGSVLTIEAPSVVGDPVYTVTVVDPTP